MLIGIKVAIYGLWEIIAIAMIIFGLTEYRKTDTSPFAMQSSGALAVLVAGVVLAVLGVIGWFL